MLITLVFSCLLFSCVSSAKRAKDYFDICNLRDSKAEACVINVIMKSKPLLIAGKQELSMPPLDPLFIPYIQMKQGTGNFKLDFVLRNLTVVGLKDFDVKSVKISKDLSSMKFNTFVPVIQMDGGYEMDGKILLLPIKGNGDASLFFRKVNLEGEMKWKYIQKSGKKYVDITNFTWSINPDFARSNFSNLFSGDGRLSDATNKFLNDNWREAFDTYKDLPEQAFGELFKSMSKKLLSLFPAKEWFPDID